MIYELVDMTEWKTKKEILKELKDIGIEMNERYFRQVIENVNKLYSSHEIDKFIVHSNKGYKVSQNEEEIIASARDFRKRGLDQLVKSSKILRALGENSNLRLIIEDGQMICTEFQNGNTKESKERVR